MRIHSVTATSQRDFTAVLECELCHHQVADVRGYDDSTYHRTVLPRMRCCACGGRRTPGGMADTGQWAVQMRRLDETAADLRSARQALAAARNELQVMCAP